MDRWVHYERAALHADGPGKDDLQARPVRKLSGFERASPLISNGFWRGGEFGATWHGNPERRDVRARADTDDAVDVGSGGDSDAALCILALLVAIDQRMGRQIQMEFYARGEGSWSAVPLSAGRVLPKPWATFGGGQAPFDKLAPEAGIDARRLYLEHQFGRLAR